MKDFNGKVAAITGAASGMGRALALELAARGCHLSLSDLDETELGNSAALAAGFGVKVTTLRLDVADAAAVEGWAARTQADHGRVNLIFNNAGVGLASTVERTRMEDFVWLMNINFWGVVHGTRAFLPLLHASGEGHVINTSSLFGLVAMPTQSAYNASKFAVRGYTEALRMELQIEKAPVSATCVHPGGIATNIVRVGRIDGSVQSLTGSSVEAFRKMSNKAIQTTTAESAARQIIKAVQKNAPRVLIGIDAKAFHTLERVAGSGYQRVMMARINKMKRPAR